MENGEFEAVDPERVALAIAAMIDGLAVQVTIEDPAVTRERMLETCVSCAEQLLRADLSSRRFCPGVKA